MLLSVACRNGRKEWKKEMHEKPKLSMMEQIAECDKRRKEDDAKV